MRTIKDLAITYVILLACLVGINHYAYTRMRLSVHTDKPMDIYTQKQNVTKRSSIILDLSIEVEPDLPQDPNLLYYPTAVADPLYGKDLYIFQLASIIEQYYPDVDPYIALAVMETESDYQPDVMSKNGAVGLMQVVPRFHAWRIEKYHLNDLWDPYTNIICGVDYINDLYQSTGDWSAVLHGYNPNGGNRYIYTVLEKADALRKDGCFAYG